MKNFGQKLQKLDLMAKLRPKNGVDTQGVAWNVAYAYVQKF